MNRLLEILEADAFSVIRKVDFSELHNKKVLITGASGLLGINILQTLCILNRSKKLNVEVIAVIKSEPFSILSEISKEKNITILAGDLTSSHFLEKVPMSDYIIHAAGYAQPSKFMSNPIKTIKLNTSTTIDLVSKLLPDGKFAFISSSEVYSGLDKIPFSENDIGTTNTNHPRSSYIEGKRCGEAIINAFRETGINSKSIRLALAYGPGTKLDDNRVMTNFIQKAINEKSINLLDDGSAMRTYCYISDVIEYIFQILFNGTQNVYNVGGYSEITIAGLAKKIASTYKIPINFPPQNNVAKGSPSVVKIDLTRAEEEFSKHEYVDFDLGLENTIQWYNELHKLYG